jgi:AcrR family transcriptional regulator
VEEITQRAGVAVGAFYVYFRSKRHVLVDLMNELLQRLQAMKLELPPGTDIQSALRVFLREAMKADRDSYGVIKAWNEAAATDPLLAKQEKTIKQWTQARVRGVCEEVIQRGRAKQPTDLNVFATIIDRHLWILLGRAPDMTKREFDVEVRVTADLIFRYLSGA